MLDAREPTTPDRWNVADSAKFYANLRHLNVGYLTKVTILNIKYIT